MGAQQVNLAPADRPGDVYSGVAKIVSQLVQEDAENGVPEALQSIKLINRKLVKQTVMTDAYGVTFIGAREQISRRLKEADPDIPDEVQFKLASYLALKVFASLKHIFSGARELQSWLNDCAKIITNSVPTDVVDSIIEENKLKKKSKVVKGTGLSQDEVKEKLSSLNSILQQSASTDATKRKERFSPAKLTQFFKTPIIWTTPLGLPVVQPYRRNDVKEVCSLKLSSMETLTFF
jgi:DNA-directed RNA polymerase